MPGFFSAFRSKVSTTSSAPSSRRNSQSDEHGELEDFLHALRAANRIMNDEMDLAESELSSGSTAFHLVGHATLIFLKATLGFEKEAMKEAHTALVNAEQATSAAHSNCVKHSASAWKSRVYDVGTEYAICHAQAQIMIAVLGVLSESVTESVKGFYKVRKAWGTLESIAAMEKRFCDKHGVEENALLRASSKVSTRSKPNDAGDAQSEQMRDALKSANTSTASFNSSAFQEEDAKEANPLLAKGKTTQDAAKEYDGDSDSESFVDAGEDFDEAKNQTASSSAATTPPNPSPKQSPTSNSSSSSKAKAGNTNSDEINLSDIDTNPISDPMLPYIEHPMDAFIHTSVLTQYGLLLFLASLIPPSFSPFLSILGFRGDRERGLSLLWRSSNNDSIQGAIAGMTIVEVYNGLVSFFDIQGKGAWPQEQLLKLIVAQRKRYPEGKLWQKEEARMCSAERDLETSITMLGDGNGPLGELADDEDEPADPTNSVSRQIKAIRHFDRSMDCLYLHAYDLCSKSFQACIDLNNWSHSLYYYISACTEIEQYRIYKCGGYLLSATPPPNDTPVTRQSRAPHATYTLVTPDEELAEKHKETATTLLDKAYPASKKKKIMAQQLPFDAFISRKITKWRAQAEATKLPLIDVIGGSPLEEMNLFWGGHGRMRAPTLVQSLRRLAFCDGDYSHLPDEELRPVDPRKDELSDDDKASVVLLRATVLRRLGMLEAGLAVKSTAHDASFDVDATAAVSESSARPTGINLISTAQTYLQDQLVTAFPWNTFKAHANKSGDTWAIPMGHYELAASHWTQRFEVNDGSSSAGVSPTDPSAAGSSSSAEKDNKDDTMQDDNGNTVNRSKLKECQRLLEEVGKWESYDLDVRMGLKISTAKGTLRKLGV
ncbi:MAG: hypothetical protein Q9162_002660 [Coniocarpon cinnabarinum]